MAFAGGERLKRTVFCTNFSVLRWPKDILIKYQWLEHFDGESKSFIPHGPADVRHPNVIDSQDAHLGAGTAKQTLATKNRTAARGLVSTAARSATVGQKRPLMRHQGTLCSRLRHCGSFQIGRSISDVDIGRLNVSNVAPIAMIAPPHRCSHGGQVVGHKIAGIARLHGQHLRRTLNHGEFLSSSSTQ